MNRKPLIQTIIFDLGDVLVHVNPEQSLKKLLKKCPGASYQELIHFFSRSEAKHLFETGQIDSIQFHKMLQELVKEEISFNFFKRLWENIFSPNPEMIQLLPVLKKNYQLILLSNTNELHIHVIDERFSLFHIFDHCLFSFQTGTAKPDPRIYQTALGLSGSMPEECLFIDDSEENVKAANTLGIQGILFTGYHDLVNSFKQYHIIY